MKAVVYNGPRDVSVEEVPDPKVEQKTDVLVKIHTTNICGSDLHMYEGRTDMAPGRVLGHENLGEIIEIGAAASYVTWLLTTGERAPCALDPTVAAVISSARGATSS